MCNSNQYASLFWRNRTQCGHGTKWKYYAPLRLCAVVLCDTHDTSILIVDTYVTIPVSPRSCYTVVYRSSTKYRETAQVSRVLTIPCSSYDLATCTLQACDAETNSKVAENHNYHNTTMSALCASSKQVESYFIFFALAQHCWVTIARHNVTGENRLRLLHVTVQTRIHAILMTVTVCE